MQSERSEDIQFGTVSEILTVSSTVQFESATRGEAPSLKVGVSLDEAPCNDFKPVKDKKANCKSRTIANQIVTHNKFQLLAEEEDFTTACSGTSRTVTIVLVSGSPKRGESTPVGGRISTIFDLKRLSNKKCTQ